MSDRPDAFIADPSKSIVLEVKAGEVVPSDVYPCRYTLRFPRVLKIRFDKDWHEAFSLEDMARLLERDED